MWNARPYRPDGILSIEDIIEQAAAAPEVGYPYPWTSVTKATFGRRLGDVIGLGGGSGCGKTDFCTSVIAHDVVKLGLPTGVIYLEQSVAETGKRIAGKIAGKRFHVPGVGSPQEIRDALAQIPQGKLHLYDAFGIMDWETLQNRMRYMVQALGVKVIWLDHLTALAAGAEDERKALEKIMAELAMLAQSLNVIIHYVSHLATPEGKPHEENGRGDGKAFQGIAWAIMYWSHSLFGIERSTQEPDAPTTLRGLKDRFTGNSNGMTWGFRYDRETGLRHECELHDDGRSRRFQDQTTNGTDF